MSSHGISWISNLGSHVFNWISAKLWDFSLVKGFETLVCDCDCVCLYLCVCLSSHVFHGKLWGLSCVLWQVKGGPEPLENEIIKILGSKREDQFSDHFFPIWYKISIRFVVRTCFASAFSVRPRGTCESSRRSARR